MILFMKLFALCFFMLNAFSCFASCDPDDSQFNPSIDLKCKYVQWEKNPTKSNLVPLLRSLFYLYASNGEDPTMKKFFDGMRKGNPPFSYALSFRDELIRKYTFDDAEMDETSGIWAMQSYDARVLFVLTQTEPQIVPLDITSAMYLAVYDEFRRFFCLQMDKDSIGILPASEYLRLLEILQRMDRVSDPFLKSTNMLYQGIVNINLQKNADAILNVSRELLDKCLHSVDGALSKKRILRSRAEVNIALQNTLEAQADYYKILKIDPHDPTALLELSYLLSQRGECKERGVWIEASILSNQTEYEIVVHCGNQLYEIEEQYLTEPPVIA
jgi:tetratricopeptide (TPR) repeat protein